MQMTVFWVVVPCSLVKVYRRFRGACCLHHQGDRHLEELSFSHRSLNIVRSVKSMRQKKKKIYIYIL
jgi:hypothetical protein